VVTVGLGRHFKCRFSFFTGIRFPVIYSLMHHDGIGSTVIVYVQGTKLGSDTNCTEDCITVQNDLDEWEK